MQTKRMLAGGSDTRRWWRHKVSKVATPFFGSAVTDLPPTKVADRIAGHHFSVVLQSGLRHYCFDCQADRDRFLTYFRGPFKAQAVGKNPCP